MKPVPVFIETNIYILGGEGDRRGWDVPRLRKEVGDGHPGTSFLLDTMRRDGT